jgi:heme/copper-type cytochrome/quinol oxidase subunit 1
MAVTDTAKPVQAVAPTDRSGIRRLAIANIGVSVAAFGVATAMALMQALSRANLDLPFRTPDMYYMSVTAHGTLMALVYTTFFIMGFGYVVAERALGRPVPYRAVAWGSFWLAVAGTLSTVMAILSFKATVLYTFYPPLKAHPAFYIGLTLVVVGSWGWSAVLLLALRLWRRENRGRAIPLAMHGFAATIIVWLLATVGVAAEMLFQLIPWSLGLTKTVDPVLARMLFWWFGHPLVYFWLLPAYVIWYTVLPRAAGGRLFSDPLGRLVFTLFILLSTPVGLHHQFMDPGIPSGWKLLHTFNTLWILYPSFVTAFTIIASLELAGRAGQHRVVRLDSTASVGRPAGVERHPVDAALCDRRVGWCHQCLVRHECDGAQHVVDSGALPHDGRQRIRAHVHGRLVLAGSEPARPTTRAGTDGQSPALYLVSRYAAFFNPHAHHGCHGHATPGL